MNKLDIFLLALKNFTRRKARSILTIIGVVIGSAAIVIMVSLGIGIQDSMMKMYQQWGDLTTVNVYLWNIGGQGGRDGVAPASQESGENPYKRALAEVESIPHVAAAMPFKYENIRLVSGKYVNPWAGVALVDAAKLQYFNMPVESGRQLREGDGFAIVLNPSAGQEFINLKARDPWDWSKRPMDENGMIIPYVDIYNDPIKLTFDPSYGEKVTYAEGQSRRRTKLYDLEVVGFQDPTSNYSWYNFMDMDTVVSYKKDYLREQMKGMSSQEAQWIRDEIERLDNFDQMFVKVDDMDNVAAVVTQIKDLGYDCWSMMESVEMANEQLALIQLIMGAVGAVSLFVAAINIANTMIMSIYERTKEIGIMKVIGCRLGDICQLFLLEAGILGLIGGIFGIGLSYAGSTLLNNLPPSESGSNFLGFYIDPNLDASLSIIPFWLVLLAMAISVGIAVLAGLYPSIRAMRLSALEAIRNE
ncbi:MAG: ABC transporter permease [Oscillospiraceae bacterium]|nr:ABC transporter permease [Oscillospiraceae bacterium]